MQIAKQIRTHFAKVIRVCQSALRREEEKRKRKRGEDWQKEEGQAWPSQADSFLTAVAFDKFDVQQARRVAVVPVAVVAVACVAAAVVVESEK